MKKYLVFILIIVAIGSGTYKFQDKIAKKSWKKIINAVVNDGQDDGVELEVSGACDQPLAYSIGNVDPRFGITQEDFQKTIAEAEKIWEDEAGKNIFDYSMDGNERSDNFGLIVKINLVFDERQQISRESSVLDQELEKLSKNVDTLDNKYAYLKKDYEKKTLEYEADAKKYEKKQKKYNADVSYWNTQGGAPADEYEKLQDENEELSDDYAMLNKRRKAINKLAKEINALIEKEGKIISDYNQKINTYKNKYGESREFEKGVFTGQEINIYEFNELSDLRLVLAHELGHALGIAHVENPQSLMYYLMAEQDMDSPKLTEEDMRAVKQVCEFS